MSYEVDAFMDGKLSVLEIRDAVSAECGPRPLLDVLRHIQMLRDAGLVTLQMVK